jgi:hypothetical protein
MAAMSTGTDRPEAGGDQFSALEGLDSAVRAISDPRDERRLIFAKGENTRHVRHDQVLRRWPILAEDWARLIEERRINSVDRTPGAATFGR